MITINRFSCSRDRNAAFLLLCLIAFSILRAFEPIEPYIVPYLIEDKKFTNFQVTNKVFPVSVYSTFLFTLLAAPACDILSYKFMIALGSFMELLTFLILRLGTNLISMQIMQVTYGLGVCSLTVFSSYIFLLATEDEFQKLTSITQASSLAASFIASELGQILVLGNVSYTWLLNITLTSLVISIIFSLLLPKDSTKDDSSMTLLLNVCTRNEGIWHTIKETWQIKDLQLLSFWWAFGYGGFSLIFNYETNLFEGISSSSIYNGHVIALGVAFGCLCSLAAVYLESLASKTGGLIYTLGAFISGVLCIIMGNSKSIWITYTLYIGLVGIKNLLFCLLYVQCAKILPNKQYSLLFSLNTVLGLLVESAIQILIEVLSLSVFMQYIAFGIYFLGFASILCIIYMVRFWREVGFTLPASSLYRRLKPGSTSSHASSSLDYPQESDALIESVDMK